MPDDTPPQSQPRGSAWPIATAVIAIAVIALAGFVFKSCLDQPGRLAETVAKATQPQVVINTLIQTSLERLRDESKLVVYTADVAVMITKISDKKVYGIDFGTTRVRLRASGNKAQLIIPLKDLSEGDFQFNEAEDKLTITLPAPHVDETLVEVQTDPNFYEFQTDVGWARLDSFSGDFLREQARRDLRPAVIAEANNTYIIKAAEQSGREKVIALMEAVVAPIRPETTIAVEFKAPAQKQE